MLVALQKLWAGVGVKAGVQCCAEAGRQLLQAPVLFSSARSVRHKQAVEGQRARTCAHARYFRYESDRKVEGHADAQEPIAPMTSLRTRSSTSLQWFSADGSEPGSLSHATAIEHCHNARASKEAGSDAQPRPKHMLSPTHLCFRSLQPVPPKTHNTHAHIHNAPEPVRKHALEQHADDLLQLLGAVVQRRDLAPQARDAVGGGLGSGCGVRCCVGGAASATVERIVCGCTFL